MTVAAAFYESGGWCPFRFYAGLGGRVVCLSQVGFAKAVGLLAQAGPAKKLSHNLVGKGLGVGRRSFLGDITR